MKRSSIIFFIVLALFGCTTASREDTATKSFDIPASSAWFKSNFSHENKGLFLSLNFPGDSSISTTGGTPWQFSGNLELDGTARMSGVLRQKSEEGNIPCWEFRISTWNDGQSFPNGMVKVTMEWAKDITQSMKQVCAQKTDFSFAKDIVPGMYKVAD